jgi:hypothetical protein
MDCCHPGLMADAPTIDAMVYLTTGFLMSLGHCLGMCGPLVAAYAAAQGRGRWLVSLPPQLLYHAGRVTTYALLGLLLGLIGSATRLAGSAAFPGGLSLLIGGMMLALGLGLAGWLPTQRWVESSRFGGAVACRARGLLSTRRHGGRFLLGVANGLLPCGPVYAMALGTVTAAKPVLGAGAMAMFGLGTVPVLIAAGLGAGRLGPAVQRRFNQAGSILVLLIGVQLALRGAAALGWVAHLRFGEIVVW